jgi:hypothetical protein
MHAACGALGSHGARGEVACACVHQVCPPGVCLPALPARKYARPPARPARPSQPWSPPPPAQVCNEIWEVQKGPRPGEPGRVAKWTGDIISYKAHLKVGLGG